MTLPQPQGVINLDKRIELIRVVPTEVNHFQANVSVTENSQNCIFDKLLRCPIFTPIGTHGEEAECNSIQSILACSLYCVNTCTLQDLVFFLISLVL